MVSRRKGIAILKEMRSRFRVLDSWRITFTYKNSRRYYDVDGYVNLDGLGRIASIYIPPTKWEYDEEDFKQIIFHELLHILLEELNYSRREGEEQFVEDMTNMMYGDEK